MNFIERFLQRDQYRIYTREYPGADPTIVLMHGFPDNLHLYDRLVPVLLNTYYCAMPTLRPPEAIFLFSTPLIRSVARPVSGALNHLIFRRMYWWQVGRFFRDAEIRNQFVPLLYQQFDATPSSRPAFFCLNDDLRPTIRAGSKAVPELKKFARPVRIIFGASDPYLNVGVAQTFHELFPTSDLFLLPGARHFVQMDEPESVARLILSAKALSNATTDVE